MNTKWREWWKHALFPQIGGRVIAHRNLMQRWIPFGAWFYYFFAAWATRRLLVIMAIALIPAAILFLLEIETYFIHIAFVITAAILMAITLGGLLRPKVNIACVLPEIVETGRKFYINYLVQNTKWHPLIDLTIESCGFPNFRDLRLQQVKLSPLKIGETRQVVGYGIALNVVVIIFHL
jgi:hypothetical protein